MCLTFVSCTAHVLPPGSFHQPSLEDPDSVTVTAHDEGSGSLLRRSSRWVFHDGLCVLSWPCVLSCRGASPLPTSLTRPLHPVVSHSVDVSASRLEAQERDVRRAVTNSPTGQSLFAILPSPSTGRSVLVALALAVPTTRGCYESSPENGFRRSDSAPCRRIPQYSVGQRVDTRSFPRPIRLHDCETCE